VSVWYGLANMMDTGSSLWASPSVWPISWCMRPTKAPLSSRARKSVRLVLSWTAPPVSGA